MSLTYREWLLELADLLGSEGEWFEERDGRRWVRLDEEFARMIAVRLRAIADKMGVERAKEWIPAKPAVEYDFDGREEA